MTFPYLMEMGIPARPNTIMWLSSEPNVFWQRIGYLPVSKPYVWNFGIPGWRHYDLTGWVQAEYELPARGVTA